jgi:hypothetical protein
MRLAIIALSVLGSAVPAAALELRGAQVAGSGSRMRGAVYEVRASTAQPAASVSQGGAFVLSAGFWPGRSHEELPLFAADFEASD